MVVTIGNKDIGITEKFELLSDKFHKLGIDTKSEVIDYVHHLSFLDKLDVSSIMYEQMKLTGIVIKDSVHAWDLLLKLFSMTY